MKNVAKMGVELTREERSLLSLGSKNVIDSRRTSLRILSSIKQKEKSRGNKQNVKWIKEYRKKAVSQLTDNCNDIMAVINEHVLPACTDGDSSVFYYKMKGDYYRYVAEFKTGADRKEVADHALKAYETATSTSNAELEPAHPIRLGLALNFSTFYYEIMNAPERACHIAKQAFVEAIADDHINDDSYSIKDSGSILQHLRDNLTLWISNISDDGEDYDEVDGANRKGGGEDGPSSSQPMKQVDGPFIFSAGKQLDGPFIFSAVKQPDA